MLPLTTKERGPLVTEIRERGGLNTKPANVTTKHLLDPLLRGLRDLLFKNLLLDFPSFGRAEFLHGVMRLEKGLASMQDSHHANRQP